MTLRHQFYLRTQSFDVAAVSGVTALQLSVRIVLRHFVVVHRQHHTSTNPFLSANTKSLNGSTMLCGCGIIIRLPQWFRWRESGKKNDDAGEVTAGPPTYISAIEGVASHVDEIGPQEVIADGPNFWRSQSPSPEPLGYTPRADEGEGLKNI